MGTGKVLAALALQGVSFAAFAARPQALREQTELSMALNGTIDIRADGSVDHYTVGNADKVPAGVRGLIDRQVPRWKFEPVSANGKPVALQSNMALRIVAKPVDGDQFAISIQSARFSGSGADAGDRLSIGQKKPPMTYPSFGFLSGMSGDVYIALKIGPDGRVADAIVQKVNLTASANDKQMANARQVFAARALATARQWTYNVPTQGKDAKQPYWVGILPVLFEFAEDEPLYGQWRPYLPGPCTPIPWPDPEAGSKAAGDCTVGPEGATPVGSDGPVLLTPLMLG